jgi:hypothetical protein
LERINMSTQYEVYKDDKLVATYTWPEQAGWYYNWKKNTHPESTWELKEVEVTEQEA